MCYTYSHEENKWINLDDTTATTESDFYLKKISNMSSEDRKKEFVVIKKGKIYPRYDFDLFIVPDTFRLRLNNGLVYFVSDDGHHSMQIKSTWIRNKAILKDLPQDFSYIMRYMKYSTEVAPSFFNTKKQQEEIYRIYYNNLTTDQKLYYEVNK